MPVLPSYRNELIDLLCKSIDWFLYEGNTDISWVKCYYEGLKDSFVTVFKILQSDLKNGPCSLGVHYESLDQMVKIYLTMTGIVAKFRCYYCASLSELSTFYSP